LLKNAESHGFTILSEQQILGSAVKSMLSRHKKRLKKMKKSWYKKTVRVKNGGKCVTTYIENLLKIDIKNAYNLM